MQIMFNDEQYEFSDEFINETFDRIFSEDEEIEKSYTFTD